MDDEKITNEQNKRVNDYVKNLLGKDDLRDIDDLTPEELEILKQKIEEIRNSLEEEDLTDSQLEMVSGGGKGKPKTIAQEILQAILTSIKACFVGDSQISTPSGMKSIKDMKLGDEVFTFDINDNKVIGKVLEIHAAADMKIVNVEFANGTVWKCTPFQWFYCGNDEYACVKDTKTFYRGWDKLTDEIGKSALTEDKQSVSVVKITDNGEVADVYDLVISIENNFIVNGIAAEGYTGD